MAPVDFPDIAQKVTGAVLSAQAERAIMGVRLGNRRLHHLHKIPPASAPL